MSLKFDDNPGDFEISYVAFLDMLGFKEIVNKNDHNTLKDAFMALSDIIQDFQDHLDESDILHIGAGYMPPRVRIINISDSIFLFTEGDTAEHFNNLIRTVGLLLNSSFNLGMPLRGGVSFGPLSVIDRNNQTNLFGKALVNAYNLEQHQEWSGCYIDEKCINYLKEVEDGESLLSDLFKNHQIIKYPIPKKTGPLVEDHVVNWLFLESIMDIPEVTIKDRFAMHNKTTKDWSVQRKIQNTIEFVKYINNHKMLIDY